ncbi:hypothetical protein BDN70DRAFT_902415, partial [Pholiota conissans]
MTIPNMITVDTKFNPSLKANMETNYRNKTKIERHTMTEKLRRQAQEAYVATDLANFEKKFQAQLSSGKKKKKSEYIRLSHDILKQQPIRINNANGDLISLILPHMDEDIRSTAIAKLRCIFPDLQSMDSAAQGANSSFNALHFSYYNRYSNRGDGTPSDADPTTLMKDGRRKINTCQNTPRRSKELEENVEIYMQLLDAFQPIFDWLRNQ